jgi:prepilin-type N-terminal cleavage/methylation domain-containing protein
MHRRITLKGFRGGERGFTAIEIAMVATVIAILSLIVLPLFRNRVDEAKIAAARADLASLMKAEMVAQADTGFFFRLEDLDNVAGNTPSPAPGTGITIQTPPLVYANGQDNRSPRGVTLQEWFSLAGPASAPRFKGAYAAITRSLTYGEMRASPSSVLYLRSATGSIGNYAAIRDLPQGGQPAGTDPTLFDSLDNRIPIDPWGNPYLFFPPSNESSYNFAAIYSLGPDGLPADEATRTALGVGAVNYQYYTRESVNQTDSSDDLLGKGDDLEVRF